MKQRISDDDIIKQIIKSFEEFNLRDIKLISQFKSPQPSFPIAGFILASCFIDQLAGFRYNKKDVGERYRKFVKEYLPAYNADDLYDDLRNKGVHNYSIGKNYSITNDAPAWHLKKYGANIILNLDNFVSDLEIAWNQYKNDLAQPHVKDNAIKWYEKYRVFGHVEVEVYIPKKG